MWMNEYWSKKGKLRDIYILKGGHLLQKKNYFKTYQTHSYLNNIKKNIYFSHSCSSSSSSVSFTRLKDSIYSVYIH